MTARTLARSALALALTGVVGCTQVNLQEALEVTEVSTGWYDDGVVDAPGQQQDGWNHLVPYVSFRLQNESERPLSSVQLTVSFWWAGGDGEFDSVLTSGIGDESVPAGGSTDPIHIRGNVGFNLEGPRADLFMNSRFKDAVAKVFARRGGRIVALGEFPVDRRVIPQQTIVNTMP